MIQTDLIAPVGELVKRHARERADKIAWWDAQASTTYGRLAQTTANLAGHLQELGIGVGNRVAILLPNSVAWIESCLAITRAGAVCVPIAYDAAPAEIAYRLSDSETRLVITTDERSDLVAELTANLSGFLTTVLVSRGSAASASSAKAAGPRYDDLVDSIPRSLPRDPESIDDTAYIIYTSGTTGRAKGVLLSVHGMLWVTAACWAPIAGLCEADTVLSPLPLFHSYALNLSVLSILAVGASEYIMEKYSSGEAARLLATGRFTVMPGVPTMFHYLLETAKADGNACLPGVRLCLSAGAIMTASLNRGFEERFGVKLLDGYGITETSTMVTLNWPVGTRVMGSCGLPVPGVTTRIVDAVNGRDVDAGEEGELIVRGPLLMKGYHNKPAETASAIRDGWYHTGDLARSDKNGFLTITGRLKELIIRGGQNIAPGEIEEAVSGVAGVLDCAAVGVAHEHLGEVPVIFVVAKDGATLTHQDILDHCRSRISGYKLPHAVHIVASIPRTGSGKVMRFKLRELLQPRG